jgi:hypothetical protein
LLKGVSKELINISRLMASENIFTQTNFDAVRRPEFDLANFLQDIRKAETTYIIPRLTSEIFQAIITHPKPGECLIAFCELHKQRMFTPENVAGIKSHLNPLELAEALIALNRNGMLNSENRVAICHHSNPFSTFMVLGDRLAHIFTPDNFRRALVHSNILTSTEFYQVLSWLPPHLFTQDLFNRMIQICEEANGDLQVAINGIVTYINNNILRINQEGINPAQSTHTASVHQSVSESAKKLAQYYPQQLNEKTMRETLEEVKKWMSSLPDDNEKNRAAKRAISRLTAPDYYFTDPTSGITTKQLLALAFTAIHDKEMLIGATTQDALKLLIDGFYELQTEYNLQGNQGAADYDKPACAAGSFNKIMEKLWGLLKLVQIIFVTRDTASKKLSIVIEEEAMKYLSGLERNEDYQKLVETLKKGEDGVEPIWDKIKDNVKKRMHDEFQSVFTERDFNNFINAGVSLQLDPQKKLERIVDIEAMKYLRSLDNNPDSQKTIDSLKSDNVSVIWENIRDTVAKIMQTEVGNLFPNQKEFNEFLNSARTHKLDQTKLEALEKERREKLIPQFRMFSSNIASESEPTKNKKPTP